MAPIAAPQQSNTGWDEARCESALAKLESLQEAVDALRLVIPRVVTPLETPLSPAELFALYKKAINEGQSNLKSFGERWQSEDIQDIFAYAQASYDANKDLSTSDQVDQFDWQQREADKMLARPSNRDRIQGLSEMPGGWSQNEIGVALEEFRKANPLIKVATKEDNRSMMIHLVAGDLKMRFHVVLSQDANDRGKLDVTCLGAAEPSTTITRCMSSRPRANDLKYLLDMIAAYKRISGSCAKCKKYLDNTALFPTARRSKQVTNAEGKDAPETIWEAFHEACLD
ncbi:hypothetical protein B0J11DRAFT_32084 [Dendryphion nanum]|uniref:Mediator complex subunit 27 n=1 Tax=Dendryphion nanum TaxID=256645 RepID=A0A9P9EKX1_9PLEO|nr:hypothetical protein B0J11DRAFT_32084 [Dendryphion nanum]